MFLGYPIWYYTMPMPVYSFLENHDLSRKTVIPFCTHGESGLSDTLDSIVNFQPGANVEREAFSIHRNDMEEAPAKISLWLKKIGFSG